jgi:hypothetical protein
MNNTQRAKLDAGNRVAAINKKYEAVLITITEYAIERKNFDDAMAIINSAAQAQSATSGTQLDAVALAKQNMANVTVRYALRAVVKAKQAGNLVLAASLNHPVTYFTKTPKTQAVYRAKEMRDILGNNLATLTNILPNNIIEISNVIDVYDGIKDNPTIEKQTKAAVGTNPLPAAFIMLDDSIDNMYDLAASYFVDTNRSMVDEFALAKQIITTGTRHNGVDGVITKAGLPIFGASITIAGSNKSAASDKDGHYNVTKLKMGDLSITATHPDGTLQTKTLNIGKATVETVDFEF